MVRKEKKTKPEISYPCEWHYTLIGREKTLIQEAVTEIINESPHSLSFSKTSRTGKYISFNLEVFVGSEEIRDYYFRKLQSHSAIRMVL